MKVYKSTHEGTFTQTGAAGAKSFTKAVSQMGGEIKQVILHGMKLGVDNQGKIMQGPDSLVGMYFDKIKNIPAAPFADIASQIIMADNVLKNEFLTPQHAQAKKEKENAKQKLIKAMAAYNKPRHAYGF